MVTGLVPFTGSSPLEVAYQHVNSNVSAPSSVQPDVPPAVDHLVLAATRKLPLERIQSAREFRDAVIRAISAVPRAEALVAVLSIQASQALSTPPPKVHREMQRPAPVQESKPGINTTGDESTNERSRLRGKLAPLIMILALLVGGGAWYQYSGTYEVVQQVDVPPIVGTLITDATTTLTALGLTTKTIQEDFDDSFAGTILSTDPVPGTSVPKGTVINVVLSKGPVLIDVPNVVGMNVETATSTLQAAGFQVEAVNKISVTILNKVYSQKPAAGTKAPKGSVITIEIV
jgi:serine/threonine-protein kinase